MSILKRKRSIDKLFDSTPPTKILLVGLAVVGIVYILYLIITNIITGFNSIQQPIVERNGTYNPSSISTLMGNPIPIIIALVILIMAISFFIPRDEY